MVETHRQDLVRTDRAVAQSAVDAVDETATFAFVGKDREKTRAARLRTSPIIIRRILLPHPSREVAHRAEGVEPQGLDLDRLALARRDGAALDPRVHPGERLACRMPFEQPVRAHADAVAGAALVPRDDVREDPEETVSDDREVACFFHVTPHGLEEPE